MHRRVTRNRRVATLVVELGAHASRRIRVGEQHRAERDVRRTARDQLQRVATGLHTAHADDRQLGRAPRRADTAASATGFSAGPEYPPAPRARVGRSRASSATPRSVLTRLIAVGARRLDRAHGLADVPGVRRKLGVERYCGHARGRRRRSRRRPRAPRRRSGRRGSARCTPRRRVRVARTSRRSRGP